MSNSTIADPSPLTLTDGDRAAVAARLTGTTDIHIDLAVESLSEGMGLDPENDPEHRLYVARLTAAVRKAVDAGEVAPEASAPRAIRLLGKSVEESEDDESAGTTE